MGQEIFYCAVCKNLVRSRDLEKGHAVRVGDQVFCRECAVKPAPQEATKPFGDETPNPRTGTGSSRIPRAPLTPVVKSPVPMIAGVVAGLVALVLLLALALGGSSGKAPARKEAPAVVETPLTPQPPPSPPSPQREPRPVSKPADRETSARRLLEEARGHSAGDLDGRLDRSRRALLEAEGTTVAEEARRFEGEAAIRVKERDEMKRADLETRVREALAAEHYGEAITLLVSIKAEGRADQVKLTAGAAWNDVKEKLLAARRRGADSEIKVLVARVEAWDVASVRDELAKALAAAVAVEAPAELLAYRKRWTEPWALALPFDYAAAMKELERGAPGAAKAEADADLEAVRLAAEVAREAPALLQKATKGQELHLERFEEDGSRTEVAGKILRMNAQEVELWTGDELLWIPLADLTPASWADLFRGRPAKKPSDARAAQLYCLFEGDAEGAGRHAHEAAPQGPSSVATRSSLEFRSIPEAEARKTFIEAEKAFHGAATRLGSGAAYAGLLKAHGSTRTVKRGKALIEDRLQQAQETFLTADDLTPSGLFAASEALKGVACFSMTADAPGGRGPENRLQFDLAAPGGDAAPRCWVYAGGCCAEVLAFGVQAPELSGPNPRDAKETVAFEPGSSYTLPVKVTASLKSKHSAHMGPKEAVRWAWVSVPLPKYPTPGARRIHLVADQQGFSVAYVWLGVGRPGPPREADVKEWERARAEIATLRSATPVQTGSLLREWWTNVQGSKIPDLLAAPGYPDRPAGSGPLTIFEGPTNFAENFGTRVRGYVHPPLTGNYVFYPATDDDAELWLSTDESPGKRRKIAGVTGATKVRDWDSPFAAKSIPIPLKAGKRYYVELLHKEGLIDDHLAVGWQLPDGTLERPIPGNRLSPWVPPVRGTRAGLYRAINFNGPPLVIDGRPWEGKDAPQFTHDGEAFENQAVPLEPLVDGPKAQMLRSSLFNRQGLTLSLLSVPPGRYTVVCYVWEDNTSETFDILLNGRVVKGRHVSGGAGHWEKVGPWTVDVADEKIEIRTTPGDANFSGIEVWRAGR